jgi:nucleotide-binding universal stress UspA family protein
MNPFHAILYPTDYSGCAAGVYPLACSLARDCGARLLVLHVEPPPVCHGEVVARRQEPVYEDILWQELHKAAPDQPGVCSEHHLAEGDAAAEIVKVAREEGCDLIVMGTHGRTGLRHALMGSVAERVLRQAPCPVLTLHGLSRATVPAAGGEPAAAARP